MSEVKFSIKNIDIKAGQVDSLVEAAGKRGQRKGLQKVLSEARNQVPYASGELCARLEMFETGAEIGVHAEGDVALIQHENENFRHPDPMNPASRANRKAKYLEDPFNMNKGHIKECVRDEIAGAMR